MVERKEALDEERLRVISLGWGTQSFGLAAMSALGVLPKVDVAVFADTGHERTSTYEFASRWTPWLEERGIQVVTVQDETATSQIANKQGGVLIPAFTTRPIPGRVESLDFSLPAHEVPTGMLRRQCTHRWKIAPIRRWLQENRNGRPLDQWLGITLDEVGRMRASDVGYIRNVYPYIELFDRPWTRGMVAGWLVDQGLEVPDRSACVFCPYQSDAEWRHLKLNAPEDFEKAVAVDEVIRHKRPGYVAYVSRHHRPLSDIDLRNAQDHGQLELWGEECNGLCGL